MQGDQKIIFMKRFFTEEVSDGLLVQISEPGQLQRGNGTVARLKLGDGRSWRTDGVSRDLLA
jgi:hypothetical protein